MTLYTKDGEVLADVLKARTPNNEGKGKAVGTGMSPWYQHSGTGRNVRGAITKKSSWKDYYDMYRTHSMVRAAIEKIAKTATNVGYDFVPRDSRSEIQEAELRVLKEFFSKQDDFIYELRRIYKDLMIYGDAYLYVVPDRRRNPIRLKRLAPKTIHIKAGKSGKVEAYYQKDPEDINDEPTRFEPHELLHFMLDDPDNDLYGLSPLESLKNAVGTDLFAQRYNASFFQNSGVTGTIIGIRNANPDEIQRNRKWLMENYTGPESAHVPIIIEGESISIEKAVTTHTEMGFLEGRDFIIREILAVLDVPPAKIGIMESANRSNSKEQDKTFRTESVAPLQYIVESVINDQFIRKILGVQNTIFVHSEGDTRDAIEQMDYFTKGEAWGIFSPNEIREKLGMAPVDGGEINGIMAPTGFVPLDRMDLYFQIPMTNTGKVPPSSRDPVSGEPPPRQARRTVTATSRDAQKSHVDKAMTTDTFFDVGMAPVALQGALVKLGQALQSDSALRQAYTYLNDASISGDLRVVNARDSLRQACLTDDPILKMGYIERAQEAVSVFITPYEPDHGVGIDTFEDDNDE